jgi:hypothetical protein
LDLLSLDGFNLKSRAGRSRDALILSAITYFSAAYFLLYLRCAPADAITSPPPKFHGVRKRNVGKCVKVLIRMVADATAPATFITAYGVVPFSTFLQQGVIWIKRWL